MTVGTMADRSSVIGLTREYRPDWSFSMILCRDFDRPCSAIPSSVHFGGVARARARRGRISRESETGRV